MSVYQTGIERMFKKRNFYQVKQHSGQGWISGRTGALKDSNTTFLKSQLHINDLATGANIANFSSDNDGDYFFIGLDPARQFVIVSIDNDKIDPLFDPVARVFKPANA